jgi:hypothetical protein
VVSQSWFSIPQFVFFFFVDVVVFNYDPIGGGYSSKKRNRKQEEKERWRLIPISLTLLFCILYFVNSKANLFILHCNILNAKKSS